MPIALHENMKERKSPLMVTVVVVTYNQEQWIRQTLDSILAQETEYPFEVIIGEDHGTDGTRAICQDYVERVESGEWNVESDRGLQNIKLLPSERNLGLVGNWANCIQHGQGKYYMGCAGDDYWHNPHMIQILVDYMENHPECIICHTDYDELNQNTGEIIHEVHRSKGIVPPVGKIQKTILSNNCHIAAVTQCVRRDAMMKYLPFDKFIELDFPREDWPMQLILSAHGEIHYIPESTATYRVGQESITRTSNYEKIIKRTQQDKRMTEYLYSLFPEWGPFKDGPFFDNIGYHYALLAAYRNNDYSSARKFAKMDKYPTKATRMAKTWLTFKLYRRLKIAKS